MLDPALTHRITAPLRTLLEGARAGPGEEALAEARALGPVLAGELVAALVDGELEACAEDGTAIRAAQLAGELGLARAAPALVRCVERLETPEPLRRAAETALPRLGAAAVEPLLHALERSEVPLAHVVIGRALSLLPVADDRIRDAFVRLLDGDPITAARGLAGHGDWRALPALSSALDRLLAGPLDREVEWLGDAADAVSGAIEVLGGAPTAEQERRLERLRARVGEALRSRLDADERAVAS